MRAQLNDFHEFIDTLISLTDNLHTAQVTAEYWKRYFEIQLVKFAMHSSSLAYLIKGTPIKDRNSDNEINYPDLGSIFLLGRAQIENYLMFYYLNVQPQTFEEGELRYFLYVLSGLSHRQQFEVSDPEYIPKNEDEKKEIEGRIQKKEDERKEIEYLIGKIKNNKFFQNLPLQKQNYLLAKRPSKLMGWEKLIENSHLDTEIFLHTWKLYSNYSHSEMIGSMQIKDYVKNPKELNRTLFQTIQQAILPTCILIKDLTKLYKTTEIIYNVLPVSLTTKIDFWWQLGTGQIKNKNGT